MSTDEIQDVNNWLKMQMGRFSEFAALTSVVSNADAAPTRQTYELFQDLSGQLELLLARLQECIDTDLVAFNELIREVGLAAVTLPVRVKVDHL